MVFVLYKRIEMKLVNLPKGKNSINESRDAGHYERVGNQTIVDSNFVNQSKGMIPNSELVHLGMGNFGLKTPNGTIKFERSGKMDGIGQDFVGRPHRMSDDKGGKLVELLIKLMTKKKRAVLSMSESLNEAKYDIGMARKGNGITVYNKAEEESGDYKNVAHIDSKGKIKYYDKKVPSNIKKEIEKKAAEMVELTSESSMKFKDILKESNVQIGKVYSNPYAKSFVKEEEEERPQAEELTNEQREAFLEAVKQYRTYGESVYRKEGLDKVHESIRSMVEVANRVTLAETGDWFDGVTVSRHMKRMNESFKIFEKTLREVSTLQQRLESSYDEIGEVLGKYYEISDVESDNVEEGNEFGAARAKAIAAGDDSFKVGDKEYKVTNVDKDDKENAKKFANESINEADFMGLPLETFADYYAAADVALSIGIGATVAFAVLAKLGIQKGTRLFKKGKKAVEAWYNANAKKESVSENTSMKLKDLIK